MQDADDRYPTAPAILSTSGFTKRATNLITRRARGEKVIALLAARGAAASSVDISTPPVLSEIASPAQLRPSKLPGRSAAH
jgi:hypothetical protein